MKKYILVLCFLFGSTFVQAYENNLISFISYCKDTRSEYAIIPRLDVIAAGADWGVYLLEGNKKAAMVYGKDGKMVVAYYISVGYENKANIEALRIGDPCFKTVRQDNGELLCVISYAWESGKSKSPEELQWAFADAVVYIKQTVNVSK